MTLVEFLLAFSFFYPLFMAWLWMFGGVYYRLHWENIGGKDYRVLPKLDDYPFVSILVPCHNEADNVTETIAALLGQEWPDFEVIAVNDASTDNTGALLDRMASANPRLRVIHLASNQGKATGLNTAALVARGEYLLCVDADAILEPTATYWMIQNFLVAPRVGAVTGNPRIRNRTSMLSKIQVGEFSSIIGLIKRAQRIFGRVFTVSGVISAYRRTALQQIGWWNNDMVTEDIDVSWRLQLKHWNIHFEPKAMCWILMPETLRGVWRQRLRWAQGGAEAFGRYFRDLLHWRSRRMWGVLVEYMLGVVWAYALAAGVLLWLAGKFLALPPELHVPSLLPAWNGTVLALTCLLQFFVSLMIDSRYEKGLMRDYFWIVWYPMVFWMINAFTVIVGVPKAILHHRRGKAVWDSPDRGGQHA
jgi:biofilm PGA synthesis N-glycosyltransferase PgaC